MTTNNDNFFEENLPKEKTDEYLTLAEGNYMACLGRVYRFTRNNGSTVMNIDHILIQRRELEAPPSVKPFEYTLYSPDNSKGLLLRVRGDGTPVTNGVINTMNFMLDYSGMSNRFKGYQTYIKRMFAKYYFALNEETGEIDWAKIAKYAGQVVAFQVIKNEYKNKDGEMKKNLNIFMESYSLIPGKKIPLTTVQEIYDTVKAQRAKDSVPDSQSTPDAPPEDLPF